jgi:hypothetical protein
MGFEFFKPKAKKEELDPIAQKGKEDERKRMLAVAGVTAAGLGAIAADGALVHAQNEGLNHHSVPASAPAEASNPTVGMKSTDAPAPVTIHLPSEAAPEQHVVNLGEKHVTIDLGEKQVTIQKPER